MTDLGLALVLIGTGAFVTSLSLARLLAYLDEHHDRFWPRRSMLLELAAGLMLFLLGVLEGGGVV